MALISERVSQIPKSGIREIFDKAQGLKGTIDLGIGEPDFETPKFIRDSAKSAIEAGLGKYTTNAGLLDLRKAISRKLKRENRIDADPHTEIIVTAGATQAIFVVLNCLLNPGDEILVPTPLFVAYKQAASIAGGVAVEVPTVEEEKFSLDFDALEGKCSSRTRVLVLNSPCNPTGSVASRDEIERACEFAEKHNLILISDEIYEKYLYDGAKHFSPASDFEFKNRIVTINGFSKTFAMTGWRLGYAVANEGIIKAMTRYNMYNAVCAPSFVQVAGISAMKRPPTFFGPILRQFAKKRRIVAESLDKIGWEYCPPRGAFYFFPKLPKTVPSSLEFCLRLLEEYRVPTVPGSSFGKAGEGHIRLSYAASEEKLKTALKRIEKFSSSFQQ